MGLLSLQEAELAVVKQAGLLTILLKSIANTDTDIG
jgi:hypothetical protein